jgi:hypothetical protein
MKKETFLAIFLGVVFGFISALIILGAISQGRLGEKTKSLLPQKKEPSILPAKLTSLKFLNITNPKNFLIIENDKVTIEGEVEKNSLIVIQSPIKELIFQNKEEKFKVDFPLALGENVIKIVSYSQNRNLKTQEKTLLFIIYPMRYE